MDVSSCAGQAVGREISQDPLGFAAGDTNFYRYVRNRPTDITDPEGTLPRSICIHELEPAPRPPEKGAEFIQGTFVYKSDKFTHKGMQCTQDMTIRVYARRYFTTYVGDNNTQNFFTQIRFEFSLKNRVCKNGDKTEKLPDETYSVYCGRWLQGVFLNPTINDYTEKFKKPVESKDFVEEYCQGAYKLPSG